MMQRHRGMGRSLAAIAVVVAISLSAGLSSASGAGGSGSGQLQIQVTQCPDGGSECSQTTQTVAPQPKPKRAPVVTTIQTRPEQPAEVHSYSLATGKGTVETVGGKTESDQAKVDPGLEHAAQTQAAAPRAPLPSVTTQGGGGFAGFDVVSSDEALARFEIPPFLLPIYLEAGRAYGVPWNVLAAINSIETDFGRIARQVSSAGALGWMQFMPASWKRWGVDATGDGYADPYNPVDAIYAAARYLRGAGAAVDLERAIYAYNHADWYVAEVLKTAGVYGSLPPGLVGETSALAYGRFPVVGKVRYGDDFRRDQLAHRRPRGLLLHAKPGAAVTATQRVTVTRILMQRSLIAGFRRKGSLPVAKVPKFAPSAAAPLVIPSASPLTLARIGLIGQLLTGKPMALPFAKLAAGLTPPRPHAVAPRKPRPRRSLPASYGTTTMPGITVVVRDAAGDRYTYAGLARLRSGIRPGTQLRGGETLGTLPGGSDPKLLFAVRSASGVMVDPRPLVDGYRLDEATNLYHALEGAGAHPFAPKRGAAVARGHYVFPIPAGVHWTPGRVDMGWDIETGAAGVGQPLVAIGNAQILRVQDMGGFGPTWISYRLLDGSAAGRTIFIGHAGPVLVKPGQTVRAGQPIILIHGGSYGGPPGHFEIGWANADGTNTLAAPHYSEGDVTGEGASFQRFVAQLPGTFSDAAFPDGLGALKPEKISRAQELALSRRLDRVSNPRVRLAPSPAAIRVDRPAAAAPRPTRAFSLDPAAAGARLIDVDVPASARAGEAYAIGTVDGTGHRGWAKSQAVVLRRAAGRWSIVGPPRDSHGAVANPALAALATVRGGRGFAVGARGAVVALHGRRAPRLEPVVTKANLADVVVASEPGTVFGYAVGSHGVALQLRGATATAEHVGAHSGLSSVALVGGRPIAAGTSAGGAAVLYKRTSSWAPLDAKFGLSAGDVVSLRSVAASRSGELWVAGGISDLSAEGSGERPFAAQLSGGRWRTFCPPSPALAGIVELGSRTTAGCARSLPSRAAAPGGAGAVVAARQGVMLATPGGLDFYTSHGFRPVSSAPSPATGAASGFAKLALTSDGTGWALDDGGRMAAVGPGADRASARIPVADALSWVSRGQLATVAVALGGDRVLALGGKAAADRAGSGWRRAGGPGVALRALAFAGAKQAWGLDATLGTLLRYDGGKWTVAGPSSLARGLAARALHAVGGSIEPGGDSSAPWGLEALAFRSQQEGYAVGDHGAIARFDGDGWRSESSPTDAKLTGVAAGPRAVVAVGQAGTLLERVDGQWLVRPEALSLVGGQDFDAAAALPDGSLLAAAHGTLIAKPDSASSWQPSGIPPLGTRVAKLGGYRDGSGGLHALALVGDGTSRVLMDGSAAGWATVSAGDGTHVADFGLDPGSSALWLAGYRGGTAVAVPLGDPSASLPLGEPGSSAPDPAPAAAGTSKPDQSWIETMAAALRSSS